MVFFGYDAQGGRFLKQLRDTGVTALFASGDGSPDLGLITAPELPQRKAQWAAARAPSPGVTSSPYR